MNNASKSGFEIFNLGTGHGNSVLEVIRAFEKATGIKVNYKIVDRREGDIEKVYADTHYANVELGWKATAGLEETLLSAWNWEKNYRENIEN
jgi:UDP-glucose 4-epimerase